MKASYCLPSGNYNILLDKDDLLDLLKGGRTTVLTTRDMPCTTNRIVFDSDASTLVEKDRKTVRNDLRFYLHDSVDDIGPGQHVIQFLSISLDDGVLKEIKKEVN